eukprot:TRINITY_DN56715_c0_g1_i1.p1 TRINITY_DN56715_c0_g1~~TRINITY_DN56715_c0_g1_i1.p1  ORF type:complete len:214 (+),score=63.61 TRINITY_DN56715_c0_g1_i1:206-847(+)
MLAAKRNIVSGDARVRAGRPIDPGWFGSEVTGCTMGIVGMGAIGSQLALRAKGFKMHTLYWSRSRQSPEVEKELFIRWCPSLEELLSLSDVVMLSVSCTEETHGLMGRDEFQAMKRTAVLVNIARGKVVDTDALVHALQQKEIGMAALDVTEPEPLPAGHPLLDLPNVLLTPHLGTATREARARMLRMAVDNLEAGVSGQALPHAVNQAGLNT